MSDPFTEHRPLLFGIAYRMLGSATEAEDMVQETWLRWQAQAGGEIRSPKAWLTTTVTRLCIDQLRSAKRQREEYYGVWLPEPLLEAHAQSPADAAALADSLSMAFMLMLETLSPVDRLTTRQFLAARGGKSLSLNKLPPIFEKRNTHRRQL